MNYQIEKNVPRPGIKETCSKYPFWMMEVDDSVLIPTKKPSNVRSAAHQFGLKNGMKFSTRITTKGNVRVWRDK